MRSSEVLLALSPLETLTLLPPCVYQGSGCCSSSRRYFAQAQWTDSRFVLPPVGQLPHDLFTGPVVQALQLYLDARLGWAQQSLAAAGKGSLSASSISQELTSFGNAVQVALPVLLRPCSRHERAVVRAPGWLMSRQQALAVVCSIACLSSLSSGGACTCAACSLCQNLPCLCYMCCVLCSVAQPSRAPCAGRQALACAACSSAVGSDVK